MQFYMGPDKAFTNLEPNIWISSVAWGVIGIASAFPYILLMPLLNILLEKYIPNDPLTCANISSAL